MKTITRRNFLTVTGTAAAACSTGAAEVRPKPSGIIDCQSHLFAPELLAYMEKRKEAPKHLYEGRSALPCSRQLAPADGDWH